MVTEIDSSGDAMGNEHHGGRLSRRSVLAGGLKAAAAIGAGSTLLPLLDRAAAAAPRFGAVPLLRHQASTGKLTVAILGNAASNQVALKAFAAFQKETGITTTPLFINVPTWVDFFQQIETRLVAGVEIDTMNLATEGFRLFASKGVLEPLDTYIAKDRSLVQAFYADCNQRTLSQFNQHAQIDGYTYYIPWGYNTMGIWYNRATFKAGGVPEPTPDWTWDDFLAAATKLTKAPNNFGMNLTIDVFQGIEPWVFTNGGQVLNADWSKVVISNPQAVEACAFARSLVAKGIAPSPGGTYNQFGALGNGTLAMMGAGIWPFNYFVENGGGKNLAIVPWPKKVTQGSPVGLAAFPIIGASSSKEEAWEFVKYSISESFQASESVPIEGGMPMRQSIATSASFLKGLTPGAEYFAQALEYATPVVGVTNASAVEGDIDTAWQQILAGSVSPAAGLAALQAKCNGELNAA
ncbi:MAG TPA: sugar ABC transporter substrate-binding protein [Caulobacteraceae bacterium]|nr:sugar ABC transporter substrate-binding protein [Caulobacteraceae bacterium]